MATYDNPITPLFEPSFRLSVRVSAAVSAGHFVLPSGNFEGSQTLSVTAPITGGNRIKVAHATAAGPALGVALWDAAADGDELGIIRSGGVVPVVSSGAIAAGAEVEVGAAGVAVTIAAGKAVGIAVSAAASNIVFVALY